jgi:predicted Zn finger-like uncharacterized protein
MPITRITCPSCAAALRLAHAPAPGKKIKCPNCGEVFAPDSAAGERPGKVRRAPPLQSVPDAEDERVAAGEDEPVTRKPRSKREVPENDQREASGAPRGKKSKKATKKGNTPLMLGLGAGALVVLILGVVGALWGFGVFSKSPQTSVTNDRPPTTRAADSTEKYDPPVSLQPKTAVPLGLVTCLCFGPEDNLLAVGTQAGKVSLFDIKSGQETDIPQGHSGPVFSLAFAPDGKTLASGGRDDKSVHVWDIAKREPMYSLTTKSWPVVAFVSAGKTLVVSGADENEVRLCEPATGATTSTLKQPRAFCVAATADGKYLAAGGMLDARVWDLKTGAEVGKVNSSYKGMTQAVALTPDGKTLITASADKTIKLWDVPSGSERKVFLSPHTRDVMAMTLTADGKILVTAAADGTACLWDAATARPIAVCAGGKNDRIVAGLALSKDGKTLVTGAEEGLKIWDLSGITSR